MYHDTNKTFLLKTQTKVKLPVLDLKNFADVLPTFQINFVAYCPCWFYASLKVWPVHSTVYVQYSKCVRPVDFKQKKDWPEASPVLNFMPFTADLVCGQEGNKNNVFA